MLQAKAGAPVPPPRPGVGKQSPPSSPVDSAAEQRREAGVFADAYEQIKGELAVECAMLRHPPPLPPRGATANELAIGGAAGVGVSMRQRSGMHRGATPSQVRNQLYIAWMSSCVQHEKRCHSE